MTIPTKDKNGNPNGWVRTVWNCLEDSWRPDQVYITCISPGCAKGPHLHKIRSGRFFCISGTAVAVIRRGDWYSVHVLGPNQAKPLIVPPGIPCELRCTSAEPAVLINMPSPAWSLDNQDEHDVSDWRPDDA